MDYEGGERADVSCKNKKTNVRHITLCECKSKVFAVLFDRPLSFFSVNTNKKFKESPCVEEIVF